MAKTMPSTFHQFKHLSVYVYVSGSILAEVKEYLLKCSSTIYIFLANPTLVKFVNLFNYWI